MFGGFTLGFDKTSANKEANATLIKLSGFVSKLSAVTDANCSGWIRTVKSPTVLDFTMTRTYHQLEMRKNRKNELNLLQWNDLLLLSRCHPGL